MKFRRLLVVLGAVAAVVLIAWEAHRLLISVLLWRGNFSLVERWGGDSYFIPAVRRFGLSRRRYPDHCDEIAEWATRRYRARFPEQWVADLAWLPTKELVLLLRRSDERPGRPLKEQEARLVILDPDQPEIPAAMSGEIDLNAWMMEIQDIPAWNGQLILLHGGGTGDCAQPFLRQGKSIRLLLQGAGRDGDLYFICSAGSSLVDRDGDGIPEVEGCSGKGENCPHCGANSEGLVTVWKYVDGSYREWFERGADCGPCCELTWSD